VPGFHKEEIKVKIKHNVLAINADHSEESRTQRRHDLKHAQPLRIERRHGALHREIHLPDNADLDVIAAKCEHGVLTVTVGKKFAADRLPEDAPRKIPIA
jgi:HSP20 family protein